MSQCLPGHWLCQQTLPLPHSTGSAPQEAMAMAASGAHPNIVRYYSAWTEQQAEGQYFYILMEKCDVSLGTKHLLDGQPFREDELLDILRQVCCDHDVFDSTGSCACQASLALRDDELLDILQQVSPRKSSPAESGFEIEVERLM